MFDGAVGVAAERVGAVGQGLFDHSLDEAWEMLARGPVGITGEAAGAIVGVGEALGAGLLETPPHVGSGRRAPRSENEDLPPRGWNPPLADGW